jgi:AAA15 family ATPase/GTPase
MITSLRVRNFKKLRDVSFNLDRTVVVIGPNNSGKTTVLQALTLWEVGMKKLAGYLRKNSGGMTRRRVPINRFDFLAIPVSSAKYIWYHQVVRKSDRTDKSKNRNIKIGIIVEGISAGKKWKAPLEFDFANPESVYCSPMIKGDIDDEAFMVKVAFMQPMSGIASREDKLTPGSINVRIGEGRTADVLRNICYQLLYPDTPSTINTNPEKYWKKLSSIIQNKFGATLNKPVFISETGEIEMTYYEEGHTYDISSSGRGYQQTLLLLAYLFSYPGHTILLDEPDAHLEVIRQRETYELINSVARELESQLIIASHSEVVLNEAANGDTVIALYDDNCAALNKQDVSRFRKLLTDIGWDKYFTAKTSKHIVFLEGTTDLRALLSFAKKLNHPVHDLLDKANIHYTANNVPKTARDHFHGLRNVVADLKGIAIFDRLDREIATDPYLRILQWNKREIENYFSFPEVLEKWAQSHGSSDLFRNYLTAMKESIQDNTAPVHLKNRDNPWWNDCKMSDDYLPQVFDAFYQKVGLPNVFNKGRFHELIDYMEKDEIDNEISEKLDELYKILKE